MRHSLAFVLALAAATPAFAQVRIVPELGLPSAPAAVAPANAFGPAVSMPALMPALAAPALSAAPVVAAPAPALAPVTAAAALVQTASALSAVAKEDKDQGAVSRRTFDAGAKTPEDAPAVAATGGSARTPALEEPNSPVGRTVREPMGPVKTAAFETVEVASLAIPLALAAALLRANVSNMAILIPAMLALWSIGAWAMRGHLGGIRSSVVDGWQASHDQKYRIDPGTGRLKDIRGHKYGSDRYEEWKAGPVGPLATGLIAAASAVAAAAFLLL